MPTSEHENQDPAFEPNRSDIDLYGPLLIEDQILRRQPPENDPDNLRLELGSFLLRVEGQSPEEIKTHERFILNALLRQANGQLAQAQLLDMGFYRTESPIRVNRQAATSKYAGSLATVLNRHQPKTKEILFKTGHSRAKILNLAHFVEVVHVPDKDLDPDWAERIAEEEPNSFPEPEFTGRSRFISSDSTDNWHKLSSDELGIEETKRLNAIQNFENRVEKFMNGQGRAPTISSYSEAVIARRALIEFFNNNPEVETDECMRTNFQILNSRIRSVMQPMSPLNPKRK